MAAGEDRRPPQSQGTDLTDSTHTSWSSASSRYGLDEDDMSPVLVYEYRGGVEVVPQSELASRVNKDPLKRVTRKPIPRGTSCLDLYGYDLCLDEEKEEFQHRAAYWVNLASVPIPRQAYWGRWFTGGYDQLYIVSRESSPDSSSYSTSRKISPSSTFEQGTQEAKVESQD